MILIYNPEFKMRESLSDGMGWEYEQQNAYGSATLLDGEVIIRQSTGNEWPWNINLNQYGIKVEANKNYILTVEVYAERKRNILIRLMNVKKSIIFRDYNTKINTQKNTYTYEFTSNFEGEMGFLIGISSKDSIAPVHVTKVTLVEKK